MSSAPVKSEPTPGETHISSLVVHVLPASVSAAAERIEAIKTAEVPIVSLGGKLVVCLETATLEQVTDSIDVITKLPDVLGCALVSHHVEDSAALDRPVETHAPHSREMPTCR